MFTYRFGTIVAAMAGFGLLAAALASSAADLPQLSSLKTGVTTASARNTFLEGLHKDIQTNIALPATEKNEDKWDGAFWGMEISLYKNDATLKAVRYVLATCSEHSDSFVRSAMDAAFTLYPSELENEVRGVARQTKSERNFAMAAHYLVNLKPQKASGLMELMHSKFPGKENDPMLRQLALNLEKPFSERLKNRPPLEDLLSQKFPGDAPVIFSFQRHDRNYPGLLVIRKQDGTFLRRADGSLFAIQQLARSMSNCPGYLTNGSTPQGIFSVQGIGKSDNSFIGPTPTLHIQLPFEASVQKYFHGHNLGTDKWDKNLYTNLLPNSWQSYVPIFEAYAAGEVGRGSIICHGTTIDTDFYKGQPYYPNTPSMGCLCALEMWSKEDGHCIYSDQLALLNAYSSLNSPKDGYLVVVELDNQKRPVCIYDVLASIVKAES